MVSSIICTKILLVHSNRREGGKELNSYSNGTNVLITVIRLARHLLEKERPIEDVVGSPLKNFESNLLRLRANSQREKVERSLTDI